MGLDVYLAGDGIGEQVWDDKAVDPERSEQYPEHYFRKNYLRSSYNESGFEHVVPPLTSGKGLHWIFEPIGVAGDGYEFEPTKDQLLTCKERAIEVRDTLAKVSGEGAGVTFIGSSNMFNPSLYDSMTSEEGALAAYRESIEGRKPDPLFGDGGWSNHVGHFYPFSPLTVRGLIPGKGFGGDGVYVIFDHDLAFWQQGAAIVVEFIDRALSIENPHITWSG